MARRVRLALSDIMLFGDERMQCRAKFHRLVVAFVLAYAPSCLAASRSEAILYSFTGAADGGYPIAGLTRVGTTFYGTTTQGGAHGYGTVFSLTDAGIYSVLYSFKGIHKGAGDALDVEWPMIYNDGALYGFSVHGGDGGSNCRHYQRGSCGTLFKVTLKGHETILHAFSNSDKTDGFYPVGSPVLLNGLLYGVTGLGGETGYGTIVSVTMAGAENVLYNFPDPAQGVPLAGLSVMNGILYGTTAGNECQQDAGQIFSITPDGTFTTLHAFAGSDGDCPVTNLLPVHSNLFGATENELFSLAPDGTFVSEPGGGPSLEPKGVLVFKEGRLYGLAGSDRLGGDLFKNLFPIGPSKHVHVFNGSKKGDGAYPTNGLISWGGSFYGTTQRGGANGVGAVFKITP